VGKIGATIQANTFEGIKRVGKIILGPRVEKFWGVRKPLDGYIKGAHSRLGYFSIRALKED